MDQAADRGAANLFSRKRRHLLHASAALTAVCLLAGGLALGVRQNHLQHQMQTDPDVATVWLAQVTHGPNHTLIRGSTLQRWANRHGIHALGDYKVLTGSFNGELNGIEFWFDYESRLAAKELECHRVGKTAFVDDLGQVYHGFLDFQGTAVGVYLPGYDHAAHRLTCTVHWMPRRPAAPFPVSRPMTFTVPLPPARRTLPPVAVLPSGPVSVTRSGITVTLRGLHLSPFQLRTLYQGQRDLLFQLDIRGGQIADENVAMPADDLRGFYASFPANSATVQRQLRTAQGTVITYLPAVRNVLTAGNGTLPSDQFTITDPYGAALLPGTASVVMPLTKPRKGQKMSPFWIAPVNGVGRGTDCVHLHFHVQPPARSPKSIPPEPVAFDMTVRVAP